MELTELTAYAERQYHIREERKWARFPGFSVLAEAHSGKWVALLMRQWDGETGAWIERCDIRAGRADAALLSLPFLSPPYRMQGNGWIGVAFGRETDAATVFRLFDAAVGLLRRSGFAVAPGGGSAAVFRDTPLFAAPADPPPADLPERIRDMLSLYEYGHSSFESKCRNFCRQGRFMADYEDDAPWNGEWSRFVPVYHDMNLPQLRGYFTWRGRLRRGERQHAPTGFAYVYLYELLNGIGADSPEDALAKMREFETGYLDTGLVEPGVRSYLRRWMLGFAVLHALPAEIALSCADPAMAEKDRALAALKNPAAHTDEAVFAALCLLSDQDVGKSPALAADATRGRRLFAAVWRTAADGQFGAVFGEPKRFPWQPLSGAVYRDEEGGADVDYVLDECRSYHRRKGVWQETRYDGLSFDRGRLRALLHEADRQLRKYLKTGHALREKPDEAWAAPYVAAVIAAEREAARPKLTIRFSGLDRIRRDALVTRDSLLTEEERDEPTAVAPPVTAPSPAALDETQTQILAALLRRERVDGLLTAKRLMPSVVADAINEALMDEIGDAVLDCDGDGLVLVEDYRDELKQILGGTDR